MISKRAFLIGLLFSSFIISGSPLCASSGENLRATRFPSDSSVEISAGGDSSVLYIGDRLGKWTLMEITAGPHHAPGYAIVEDFTDQTGHLVFVAKSGVRLDLSKSLEPTS